MAMDEFSVVSRNIFRKSIEQRDELIQQRDELIQQRDSIFDSTIWKYTKFIRNIFNIVERYRVSKNSFTNDALSIDCLENNQELFQSVLKAKRNYDSIETLRHALRCANLEGIALEFGVYSGRTLNIIAERYPDLSFGFDSFDGLPEDWREGYPKGTFKIEGIPNVENARIMPGLFQDTLKKFMSENTHPISFIHLDADLYSSTKFVLSTLNARIEPGCIILFDEFMNYPGFENHEYLAYVEWCAEHFRICEPICFTANHEQLAFKVVK
jgi:hypothetical protein